MILETILKNLDLVLQAVELIDGVEVGGRWIRLTFSKVTGVMICRLCQQGKEHNLENSWEIKEQTLEQRAGHGHTNQEMDSRYFTGNKVNEKGKGERKDVVLTIFNKN